MRNDYDVDMIPIAKIKLERLGYKVKLDGQITHDAIVNGIKEEWKFLKNVYKEFYFELFQCADPSSCKDCKTRGNTQIMLGWAHPESYCKAEIIREFWGNREIKQMAWAKKDLALEWLWNKQMKERKVFRGIANWDGQHRTIGVAVKFQEPPAFFEVTPRQERMF